MAPPSSTGILETETETSLSHLTIFQKTTRKTASTYVSLRVVKVDQKRVPERRGTSADCSAPLANRVCLFSTAVTNRSKRCPFRLGKFSSSTDRSRAVAISASVSLRYRCFFVFLFLGGGGRMTETGSGVRRASLLDAESLSAL